MKYDDPFHENVYPTELVNALDSVKEQLADQGFETIEVEAKVDTDSYWNIRCSYRTPDDFITSYASGSGFSMLEASTEFAKRLRTDVLSVEETRKKRLSEKMAEVAEMADKLALDTAGDIAEIEFFERVSQLMRDHMRSNLLDYEGRTEQTPLKM